MSSQKKVLFLIEDGSFTFDNRVIRETKALIDDGWDVTVICAKYPQDPYFNKISDVLRVIYYPKLNARNAIGHIIEHSTSFLATFVLTFFAIVRYKCRVIHGCNPMDVFWLTSLPYKLLGIQYIYDQHDLCPELYLSREEGDENSIFFRILLWLEKMSYKFADVVISTNESYKDNAINRGGKDPNDVFVVRNGPDIDKFKNIIPRTDLKKEGDILVGYLGNMNPQDGVDYLLQTACAIVQNRQVTNIKFVCIGKGSSQAILSKKSSEMGLDKQVTFMGRLPDGEMLATLSACDICVQPDPLNPLNDKSTMNKVLEYMALGKPVVTFDLQETRVSCGDAAIYAKPNDVSEMADKIQLLAKDSDWRIKLGLIGRERVKEKLAWSHSIPNLLAAYERVKS